MHGCLDQMNNEVIKMNDNMHEIENH